MTKSCPPVRILVTGASGGLGGALARHHASAGVRLSLWGRDEARLSAIAETCRTAGADVQTHALDIRDIEHALATLDAEDAAHAFDLAYLASGVGDVRADGDLVEDAGLVARLGMVNFAAPAAMAARLAAHMATRRRGGIVLVGSAAAFHTLPFAAAYSATKAGLARFAEALRIAVRPHGVAVTLVSPGFIDTAAARRVPGPKPLMMTADDAAARISHAAAMRRAHLVLPRPFAALRIIDRLLPRFVRDRLLLALAPPPR